MATDSRSFLSRQLNFPSLNELKRTSLFLLASCFCRSVPAKPAFWTALSRPAVGKFLHLSVSLHPFLYIINTAICLENSASQSGSQAMRVTGSKLEPPLALPRIYVRVSWIIITIFLSIGFPPKLCIST